LLAEVGINVHPSWGCVRSQGKGRRRIDGGPGSLMLRERVEARWGPSLRSEFVTFSNAPKFGVASNVVTVTKIGKNQKSHNLSE